MTQEQLLDGTVIVIDKPYQWTSFQVVNKIKSTIRHTYDLKKFKIGHAGTLDPLATGVLPVCVGKATKRIDELQGGEKVYSGTMVLGATTPCYDLERAIDHYYPYQHITEELLTEKVAQFIGEIEQVPPIFSAVKIGGQRAYSYAREAKPGEEPPSPTPKKVHVKEFTITAFRPGKAAPKNSNNPYTTDSSAEISSTNPQAPSTPLTHLYNNPLGTIPDHLPQLDFRIRCGKGTYIRSLARDLGLALDSGAFLSALRREQVGEYTLAEAIQLDDIQTFLEK
jgi:tRNA pseudouridine55 synthase